MSVIEKLKSLETLQKLDLEIMALQKEGDVHPKRLAELDTELGKLREAADAQRSRLAENERGRRTKEQEIQDEKDKVKKWEGRLAEMRTTREYAALAREIDIAKKANLTADDELKTLIGDAESLKRELTLRESELRQRERACSSERKKLEEQIGSLQGKVDELNKGRAELAARVDRQLLSSYENIRKKRGQALVPVLGGGICSGCQIRLAPQQYNILLNRVSIEQCPSCNRLLYVAESADS